MAGVERSGVRFLDKSTAIYDAASRTLRLAACAGDHVSAQVLCDGLEEKKAVRSYQV